MNDRGPNESARRGTLQDGNGASVAVIHDAQIGEFCETGAGSTPSRAKLAEYYGGRIPWVKSGELREGLVTTTEESVTPAGVEAARLKLVPKGSLLIAMYGATVGRTALLGIDATTNQAVCHLRPDPSRAETRYVWFALQAKLPELLARRVGGAQPNISQETIRTTRIRLPALPEQRRIADILDKADAIRRKRKQAIALTEGLLRSAFSETFADLVRADCRARTLAECCSQITDGAHLTPTYVAEGAPFLRVTDIQGPTILWDSVKRIPWSEHGELTRRCRAEPGDVLYSKNGTIGIPRLVDWDDPFTFFVSLCLLKPHRHLLRGEFLESFLASHHAYRQATAHAKTLTVSNLHLVEIRKMSMPLPSLSLQDDWILRRRAIEREIHILRRAAAEADGLFGCLTQRYLSGQQ